MTSVDVHDIADPLDVHYLAHDVTPDADSHHVIAWLDQVPGPRGGEGPSPTLAGATTNRSLSRTEVDLAGLTASRHASNSCARVGTARRANGIVTLTS